MKNYNITSGVIEDVDINIILDKESVRDYDTLNSYTDESGRNSRPLFYKDVQTLNFDNAD